ncbi:hypothetical protein XSR1_110077 [Xenorhabdus szentirmaii DSM 16338]|uniref:Uncharacterized protein n=1 Tax=Xenorhabdus szentirmaii DSM 16338 TaxID=1427518 RepID=W1IRY5_9GAMM|nr:hypothetical protein XSR1_110077 [Xenorhabdus szentirmaii DSM 16338]
MSICFVITLSEYQFLSSHIDYQIESDYLTDTVPQILRKVLI